jgi:hypothetical protein
MQQLNSPVSRRFPVVWLAVIGAIVLAVYIALIWAMPRGFDWTDEAWIYSLIGSNRVSVGEAWGFQHVLHPLFVATGQSVLVFRSLRLVGYFLVSAFLLVVAYRVTVMLKWRLSFVQWLLVFAGSQIGTFLAWSYPPRTLGYDELSAWLTQIGVGVIVLLVVSRISSTAFVNNRILWLVWAGLGAIAILLLTVKITSGVAFCVLGVVALFIRSAEFGWIKRVLATVGGLVVSAVVLLIAGFPFVKYVQDLLSLVFDKSAQSAYDHPVGQLVKSYALSLAAAFRTLSPTVLLVVVLVALLAVLGARLSDIGRERLITVVAIIIAGLVAISLIILPSSGSVFENIGQRAIFLAATAFIVFAILASQSTESAYFATPGQRWVLAFGVVAVLASPFISAVGTNNTIVGELLYSSTIWASVGSFALVLLGNWLLEKGRTPWLSSIPLIVLVVLVVMSAVGVEEDIRTHPYRTPPYATQNTPTHATFLSGMLLTAPAASWADWLSQEASRLHAGKIPAIAISSPGAILEFNNSAFASPWVETFWPVSFASIEASCKAGGTPQHMFVLQPKTATFGSPVVKETQNALQACDISFPADFKKVATHTSSDAAYSITIWSLK